MALAQLLRLPLRLIPKNTVLRVKSGVNKGFRWRVGSTVNACWVGNYERETQAAISRLTRPGDVCFDLGANAGFFTLATARLTQPGGLVFAFEPLPANGSHLLAHQPQRADLGHPDSRGNRGGGFRPDRFPNRSLERDGATEPRFGEPCGLPLHGWILLSTVTACRLPN